MLEKGGILQYLPLHRYQLILSLLLQRFLPLDAEFEDLTTVSIAWKYTRRYLKYLVLRRH